MAAKSGRMVPFPIGKSFGDGTATYMADKLGMEVVREYKSPHGPTDSLDGRMQKFRLVRNGGDTTLNAKEVVKFSTSDGEYGKVVSGLAGEAEHGYPVDQWLPASGVPKNHLFWLLVEGPGLVKTPDDTFTAITVGATVVAAANGRVVPQDTTKEGADVFPQIQNRLGRALQAQAAEDADVLIEVGRW